MEVKDVHKILKNLCFFGICPNKTHLHSITDRFSVIPLTLMHLVNAMLYILIGLKRKHICWPKTEEEYETVKNGFRNYPGYIGAVDGCHIAVKISLSQ